MTSKWLAKYEIVWYLSTALRIKICIAVGNFRSNYGCQSKFYPCFNSTIIIREDILLPLSPFSINYCEYFMVLMMFFKCISIPFLSAKLYFNGLFGSHKGYPFEFETCQQHYLERLGSVVTLKAIFHWLLWIFNSFNALWMSFLHNFQFQNCIAVAILKLIKGAILNLKHVKGTIRKIWVCCYPESPFPSIIMNI